MGETRYQIDLLNAMNEKLISNDRMMQTIVGTSNNAFLYYAFHSDKVNSVIGNISFRFGFLIKEIYRNCMICLRKNTYMNYERSFSWSGPVRIDVMYVHG